MRKPNGYWTYEHCLEESKKYDTVADFRKGAPTAWEKSVLKNKWIKDFTWIKPSLDIYGTPDCVYRYFFKDFNTIYVGRTIRPKRRDNDHIFDTSDTVNRFAFEHNIPVPEMEILETNLTLIEGQEREEYYVNLFLEQGFNLLNKAKTGSLGCIGCGKWTYKVCYEEALKYKTRQDFNKGCQGAYIASCRNKWLDNFYWFEPSKTKLKWAKESFLEFAKKFEYVEDLKHANESIYWKSKQKGWFELCVWLKRRKPLVRPVAQKLNGKIIAIYSSSKEAFRKTGISDSAIRNVCLRLYGANTAGGYEWEYAS